MQLNSGGNMRRIVTFSLTAGMLLLGLSTLATAYPRTVLLEDFTNWG